MKKISRTRKAFTLIELLVVIAIIAILAAILFPVFATVREQARQSSTMSNMQAVYIGAKLYNEDEGHYPSVLFGYAEMPDKTLTPPYRLLTAAGKGGTITAMHNIAGTYRAAGQLDTNNKLVANSSHIVAGHLYHEQIKDYVTFLAGDDAITDQTDTTLAYYPPNSPDGSGFNTDGTVKDIGKPVAWTVNSTSNGCSLYGDADIPATDNDGNSYGAGTPKVYYKMDAMDIGPMIDGNGKVVHADASGNVVATGGQIVYELHYSPDWTGELWNSAKGCDVDPNTKNPLSAQLKYKNPPSDHTVLTYITSHVAFGNSAKVMVLLLSGTAKKMEAKDAAKQLPLNY